MTGRTKSLDLAPVIDLSNPWPFGLSRRNWPLFLASFVLALVFLGGPLALWRELVAERAILFWPLLGGFLWVVGDLFQNYATKYVGISRGIPLSNTNQLWGLFWAILVFGELRGLSGNVYAQVIGGSLLMAAGAMAIALSSASEREYSNWRKAAQREMDRYGIDPAYVTLRMEGREPGPGRARRGWIDWVLIGAALLIFGALGAMARAPRMEIQMAWLAALSLAMLIVLIAGGLALRRVTGFS